MKQNFGRGIESLIPKKINRQEEPESIKEAPIFYVAIEKVKSNPYQPRKNFDQDGLNALSDSIRDHGVLQPLLVSRMENEPGVIEYQLIAGERRLLASKMVGLAQVPVIIKDPSEQQKLEVSIVENVQRLDLNSMEKAEAYKRLQEEFKYLQKDIAKLVGRSRESVANTMRLLDLPDEVKQALRDERISEGHARAILAVNDPQRQREVFIRTVRDGLNVREVENLSQKLSIWQPAQKIKTEVLQETKELEEKIKKALGLKALKLRIQAGRPKLTVFFNSKKEIDGLLEKIKI
jgi:ParB family chromosome partitioning protein